ncbi:MAG: diguanylate cyclase (GGDEF)-like protein [Pseudoalteromonas tetraodonis]|jgi:diguanylate cyclase (GGDEF)-like protein
MFSLKWKAILTLAFVLLLSQIAVLAMVYANVSYQLRSQLEDYHHNHQAVLTEMNKASAERMRDMAPSIAALSGLSEMNQPFSADEVSGNFLPRWYSISGDIGLAYVAFYSKDSDLLVEWGLTEVDQQRKAVDQLAADTLRSEEPNSLLVCYKRCYLYVAVPLLDLDAETYVVVLSSPLEQLVIDVARASGADFTILVDNKSDSGCCWGKNVSLSTQREFAEKFFPYLDSIGYSDTHLTGGFTVPYDGKEYLVSLVHLGDLGNHATEILVADVSREVWSVRDSFRILMIVVALVIILSVVVLLGLLWGPMSHLRRLADALPLLSERKYSQFRYLLDYKPRDRAIQDEIAVLDMSSIAVSENLENMEHQLLRHSDALARRASELSAERDLISGILNTTQVIILSINEQTQIERINQFGLSLLSLKSEQVVGRRFDEVIDIAEGAEALNHALEGLVEAREGRYRHDSVLLNEELGTRSIAWMHTAMSSDSGMLLSVGMDVTEQLQAEARLSWVADHDALTSLYNRNRFTRELEREVALAGVNDRVAVLLFGVDNFKDLNGTMGYQAGDNWLQCFGSRLRETAYEAGRTPEWVARLSGDEFAVMLPNVDDSVALSYVAEVTEALRDNGGLGGMVLTASVGMAVYPEHGTAVRELMSHADIARNTAKQEGGGRCNVYSESELSGALVERRVYWRQQISDALENDGFSLFYQPIVELADHSVSHCEVLLRMVGKGGELISPAKFIDVAESSNLVGPIERWVLTHAVDKLVEMQEQGITTGLSINLSGRTFNDPRLVEMISGLVVGRLADPSKLIFELTETAAVANLQAAADVISTIRDLGCRFAFDDFGSGFTSFEYIKVLPVDYIKLDASFVKRVHLVKDDQTLVTSMVEMLQRLGKQVIAEGVEDEGCYIWLRDHGVEYIQGYYFGRPAPTVTLEVDKKLYEL